MLSKIIETRMREIEQREGVAFIRECHDILMQLEQEIHQYHLQLERLDEHQQTWNALSDVQKRILRASRGEYGTSIHSSQEAEMRAARAMMDAGLLTSENNWRAADGRHWFFYITIKGQRVLAWNVK
jgi:hypothetical protein